MIYLKCLLNFKIVQRHISLVWLGGGTFRDQSLLRKCPVKEKKQAGTSKSLGNLVGWIVACCRWPSVFRWFPRLIAGSFNPERNAATTLIQCQNGPLWLGMARYFHSVWKGLISPTWYHVTRQLGALNIWHVHVTPQSSTNTTVQLLLQLSKEAMRFQLAWEPCTTLWSSMPPRAGMRWLFPSASRL